jgi:hypothetical protein
MRIRGIFALWTAAALALATSGPSAARELPRLVASVGPGRTIFLTDARGAKIKNLRRGIYRVVVHDRSMGLNFHLVGQDPLLAKKTGIRFVGTTTWRVEFIRGTYRYFSDTHRASMTRSFKVT